MLAITSLMSLAYIFGITSAHYQEDGLIITFLVLHLILAFIIFGLRCIMDEQVSFFPIFSNLLMRTKQNNLSPCERSRIA